MNLKSALVTSALFLVRIEESLGWSLGLIWP